jgi:chromosome segregation ATPase
MEKKMTKRPKAKPTIDVAIAQKDIQIAVYVREIEAQAGEIRTLRSELGKAKAASDSERASHSAKLTDFQGKMSSLESEVDRLEKALSEERAAAHAAQERFLSEIESMRKGNADVMARLTAAESGKEALSADKAKLTAENARISEECRAAREALDRSLSDAGRSHDQDRALPLPRDHIGSHVVLCEIRADCIDDLLFCFPDIHRKPL